QVRKFKSVADSTPIEIDPDVTALVGKNESGKTAVLQAMYRFKPIPSGHATSFEELRDYPRRYRARDKATIPETEPVTLTFELDDNDRRAFEEEFGTGTLADDSVSVSRRYGDQRWWFAPITNDLELIRGRISEAGL